MSYLVFCTFDLKNATAEDYKDAYADLEKIGLKRTHKADQGNEVVIPTTAAMGLFDGKKAEQVCAFVHGKVQAAFKARNFKSEVFVMAGGEWAWNSGTTASALH